MFLALMEYARTMKVIHYRVNAFAEGLTDGNPASVFLHREPIAEDFMQGLAGELQTPMTTFVSPGEDGFETCFFTPGSRVHLSGHGAMSSAHAVWRAGWLPISESARILGRGTSIVAHNDPDGIEMAFEPYVVGPVPAGQDVAEAIGAPSIADARLVDRGGAGTDLLVELDSERAVRAFEPDFELLASASTFGIIITAPAEAPDIDFVSRFFAPAKGIDEDPVTGTAHCSLIPYWCEKLGKAQIKAYQCSKRGGYVAGRLDGGKVHIKGPIFELFAGEVTL